MNKAIPSSVEKMWLGHWGIKAASNALAQHVDEGDVTKRYTTTSSGEQQMTFINESGLYSLILSC